MNRRGQALALFALTMLLLVVMVLITLAIAQRTRDRIEAQMAVDAAAYSNAVVAARTFNSISLLNRASVSHMVAVTGMQSLMSWSGHHRANLGATLATINKILIPTVDCCNNPCPGSGCCSDSACSCFHVGALNTAKGVVIADIQRIEQGWEGLDDLAANQAFNRFRAAAENFNVGSRQMWSNRMEQLYLHDQNYTRRLVASANPSLGAPAAGDQKTREELAAPAGCGTSNFCDPDGDGMESLMATMGSRGYGFVSSREGGYGRIWTRINQLIAQGYPQARAVVAAGTGGSGFGPTREHQHVNNVDHSASWAEDHGGILSIMWAPSCPPAAGDQSPVGASAIATTDQNDTGDRHLCGGLSCDITPPYIRHKALNCNYGAPCPAMWPVYIDKNDDKLDNEADHFGQPVLYSIVTRDHATAPRNPWELTFTFRQARSGSGERFEGGNQRTSGAGADLSKQVVMAASMAYYHRPGRWNEPSNFFNPFWRATLVKPDADAKDKISAAGFPDHAQTLQLLENAGFRGRQ